MLNWSSATITAAALIVSGGFYMRLRWRRSPQAYRAMIALAACYFLAGSILGAWILHLVSPKAAVPIAALVAPSRAPVFSPFLKYNPAAAVLPNLKLTPGDTFPGVTASDVCSYGWAKEHREVSPADKSRAYDQYPDWRRTCACEWGNVPDCCEVDHLIPLELGGSNDIKNLWPQPIDPRPGSFEKDQLEDNLHQLVCKGTIALSDAQKCVVSNWVECWKKYVVPDYGPAWAEAYRHGW